MIDFVKEVILTNLYWFSLPLIGYAFLRIFKETKSFPKPLRNVADIVLRQHPFCIFVAGFAVTTVIFAIISIFFYLFRIPVLPFVIIYLIFFIVAVGYLLSTYAKNGYRNNNLLGLKEYSHITKLLSAIIVILLSVNYVIDIYNGAYWGGDTIYHLSRMVDILANGFNIQNGFNFNLPESAYHFNVIYTLFVIPAKLFGVELISVWRYSLGFFVLTSLLTSFVFVFYVFSDWIGSKKYALPIALLSIFPVMAFHSSLVFIYNYPNKIVLIWITLLILCCSKKINKSNYVSVLLVMACLALLITTTHPLYSVISVCFLLFFVFARLVIEKKDFIKDKLSMTVYSITVLIMMLGPLVTMMVPSRLSYDYIDIEEHSHITFLGAKIVNPDLIPRNIEGWVFLLLGIISSLYLILVLKRRKQVISLAIALMSFYAFFACTPICMILEKIVPVWVVVRFEEISEIIFQHYFIIGLFCLFGIVCMLMKKNNSRLINKPSFNKMIQVSFALVVIVSCISYIQSSYGTMQKVINNAYYYDIGKTLINENKDIFNNNQLVVSRYGSTFSSLFPIDILFASRGHQPLASDGFNRGLCISHIIKTYDYADLKAIGANYVLDNKYYIDKYVQNKPYLKLVKEYDEFDLFGAKGLYVYEFVELPGYKSDDVYGPCLEYQQNEKN